MPAIERAYASIDTWPVGLADPIATDRGYVKLDIIDNSFEGGIYQTDVDGIPLLEYVKKVGLVGRPRVLFQDTRLANHSPFPAGAWDEVRSTGGGLRKYSLRMFDPTPGLQWGVPSNYQLPANPHIAFRILRGSTPSGWSDSLDRYLRIELAGGLWGLFYSETRGNYLIYKGAGYWQAVTQINNLTKLGDLDETWLFVRHNRGRLYLSTDFGQTYNVYGDDENPINIPQGAWGAFGQGGVIWIGLHSLRMFDGWYQNFPEYTFKYRDPFFSQVVITGRYELPAFGTGVTFQDAGIPLQLLAAYRANLFMSQVTAPGLPIPLWATPVLGQVTLRYPFRRDIPITPAPTQPLDPYLRAVDVDKPQALDGSTAIIRCEAPVSQVLEREDWSWRKVRINLGYRMDDASNLIVVAFTGYVDQIEEVWDEYFNRRLIQLNIHNASLLFKRSKWLPIEVGAFAGMLPNDAADYVLKSEGMMDEAGLDGSRRSWHISGLFEANRLPIGSWEDPAEMMTADQQKWESIVRVQSHHGCEAGADDDGLYFSVPFNNVDPTVSWTFHATSQSQSDLRKLIKSARHFLDTAEQATTVAILGTLRNGARVMSLNHDTEAELNVVSGRFTPCRQPLIDEIPDRTDAATVIRRGQALSELNFGLHRRPDIIVPVNPELYRHARIDFIGCGGIDIPDGTHHKVLTLRHSYRNRTGWATLDTVAGLKRI